MVIHQKTLVACQCQIVSGADPGLLSSLSIAEAWYLPSLAGATLMSITDSYEHTIPCSSQCKAYISSTLEDQPVLSILTALHEFRRMILNCNFCSILTLGIV